MNVYVAVFEYHIYDILIESDDNFFNNFLSSVNLILYINDNSIDSVLKIHRYWFEMLSNSNP